MKKVFIKIAIFVFIIFVSFKIVYAYSGSFGEIFGGKITNTKATEIEELENAGYQCETNGSTITINPIKGGETYFIPDGVNSVTRNTIATGQWILGKYSGTTTITCTKECGETECTDTATLNNITMFGNSK
jgi:hypothetical protein